LHKAFVLLERRRRQSASAGDVGRIEEVLYSSGSVVTTREKSRKIGLSARRVQ